MSSLPEPAASEPVLWSRFTADPRQAGSLRASDADRTVATDALNAAFEDGRLDTTEHGERIQQALVAKTLGDLVPLVSDIAITPRRTPTPPRQRIRSGAVRSWLGLALLFNVIWLATWLFSGDGPYYYWPIWPMIGTGIPVLFAWMATGRGPEPERPEIERR